VATILGRRLEAPVTAPARGAVLDRRAVGVLGAAAERAARLQQVIRQAGWEPMPMGELLGDGAHGLGTGADPSVPGVRPTLAADHLREHGDACANRPYPQTPTGATAWVDQNRGARRMDRGGEGIRARQRRRPWPKAVHDARAQLIGAVARTRTRIRDQDPWPAGRAVGSGAVEGGCTHVMPRRFQRAGLRWKPPGCLHVLALRLARRNGT
jgi:hypothetical protein